MAVKDGLGPRPVAQSAKRYFLNRQETEVQTVTLPATAAVQAGVQGPCRRAKTPWQWRTGLRCLAAGFCAARLRSRDPLAGLKHHGSEGRSGPAARSPECQTLLSEPTRNWGPNRDFFVLPRDFTRQLRSKLESKDPVAGLKHHGSEGRACVVLQLAFVLHGSGQGTPSQGSNTMAVTDGLGPRPVSQSAKRYFLNRQETEVQTVTLGPRQLRSKLESKDPVAGLNVTMAVKDGPAKLAAGFCCTAPVKGPPRRAQTPWQWRTERARRPKLESKDPVAGLKHHGSEGRACVVLQLAFVLHGSGQGTPSQGSNTMAVKDGAGPKARSPECQTVTLPATAAVQAGVQEPCRRSKTPCDFTRDTAPVSCGPSWSPRTLSQG